jgi:predicted metal-dependent hydrolase
MDNFTVVRSLKRKSVSIRILPDGSVKVSVPYFYPKLFIKKILQEKEDWIKEKQHLIQNRQTNRDNQNYLYLGTYYPLQFRDGQKELIQLEDKLYIGSPNRKYIATYLTSWYKQQARKIITERVAQYAKIAGLRYKSVSITSADTRWGSCSSQKTLNFNWKLVMAPLEVMDYVIAHELAHLTELNHSRDFWETVRKMYPLYRQYRTWLKRNGHTLTIE